MQKTIYNLTREALQNLYKNSKMSTSQMMKSNNKMQSYWNGAWSFLFLPTQQILKTRYCSYRAVKIPENAHLLTETKKERERFWIQNDFPKLHLLD